MSEPKGSRCAMSHRYFTEISSLEATARRICESRGGKWSGTKGMARCPAHDDRTPSLGHPLPLFRGMRSAERAGCSGA